VSHAQDFPRVAGVAVPLFSLRGAQDVGTGTILDLIPFIDWLARWHQRVLQLLPINESGPGETSPYNTLSAFAIDPAYVSALAVIDVQRSGAAQEWLRSHAVRQRMRRVRAAPQRQRRAAYQCTVRLLAYGFEEFTTHPDERTAVFERFCQRTAWWLDDYALFRALKERRRWTSWETWTAPLRERATDALAGATAALQSPVRFCRYLQWIAAEQWAQVRAHARSCGVLLKGDVPFVCGRDSADVWAHQDLFDPSGSAGAPPDAFSATGQAWGLPLYNWEALRHTGYEWWLRRARQAAELYDMFRVDHVVGLYRTYAIPTRAGGTSGFVPAAELEQRMQGHALLSAVLEEAGAAGVIAEDLGTVPDWVRDSLTQLGIPGYKVFRWEQHADVYLDPRTYSPLSVCTTGTHDTDTLAAWWEGLDQSERSVVLGSLDLTNSGPSTQDSALDAEVHLGILRRLYEAGSVLTILPIQDLFGWTDRINTPATIDPNNWTYRLPVETGQLDETPAIRQRMEAIREMIDGSGRS